MSIRQLSILAALIVSVASTATAGTKEELVRLQNDVLTLQNQMRLFEKTFNEQIQGLRSLVVQLNDQVGTSSQVLGKVAASLETRSEDSRSDSQVILQEIRDLRLKVDDTATGVAALARQISELKIQSKALTERTYQSAAGDPSTLALSADNIFNEAFNDLVQGNFDMAIEGFGAYIKSFPSSEKADDAQYNIGEAYYNSRRLPQAIAAFTRVIDEYPSGDKVASASFKRGKAELALGERDNAIEDFRTVVEKFPAAPESSLAKAELDSLGVSAARKPRAAPSKRRP
ncbi:MAG: tol-pal system protein YbgF [Acidobacteria bacterium]|nr:tol-pal system protein YbgF [Acidobacteriota bacterium]